MSEAFREAEDQLRYTAPAGLPVEILSVSYGEAIAVPDVVEVVNVAFQHTGRPGVLVESTALVGNWQRSLNVLIRRDLAWIERVYACLPGWPPPTPGLDQPLPGPGDMAGPGGEVVPV